MFTSIILPGFNGQLGNLSTQGNYGLYGEVTKSGSKPKKIFRNADGKGFNGEPMPFSLERDQAGCFGVVSDSFSYLDHGSYGSLTKGHGGLQQMYNYATAGHRGCCIETPPDRWKLDKVFETAMKDMES